MFVVSVTAPSLCAGSITAYSLYGHLFLTQLRYTQLEVNAVAIAAELGLYLPVPFMGYLCDRYRPGLISLLSSLLFGAGYLLAALTYRRGPPTAAGGDGWPLVVMILAFVGIGAGTCAMYLSAVTTCAKNFGRGRHKGFALAMPIAAFGLSGMWLSQVGAWFFSPRLGRPGSPDREDGAAPGAPDCGHGHAHAHVYSRVRLDVFHFFLFLSVLLFAVGLIGGVFLQVVDEEDLIDRAAHELERSGVLVDAEGDYPDAAAVAATTTTGVAAPVAPSVPSGYGTVSVPTLEEGVSSGRPNTLFRTQSAATTRSEMASWKKALVLKAETRLFLADQTMWWLAAGFFLVTGPGEAFINNVCYTTPPLFFLQPNLSPLFTSSLHSVE